MSADIDIDLADRQQLLALVDCVPARLENQGHARLHNSGIYVVDIPRDPVAGCASINYHEAEQRGYFKIDLLNVSVYQLVQNPKHYEEMLAREPPWQRLWQDPNWARQITHVGNYCNLLSQMRPDSITRMAAFISLIRPGKAHLQHKPWDEIFRSVWDGDASHGFVFKKSHAIGYAHLVALHMNLLDTPNQSD